MPDDTRCPECACGKHANCDGTAWDDTTDAPTACECADTAHAIRALRDAVDEAYTDRGRVIWWANWRAADPDKRRRMEAGILAAWSGETPA